MQIQRKLDKKRLPEPVFDEKPEFVELYWKAWQYAHDHIYQNPELPQSPYMDEALTPDTIWIWDTCFMVLYCRYAFDYFPGIESLNNFYIPLHDGVKIPVKIQHIDNPPLFAWVEYEFFKYTGDIERLNYILLEKKYLQKHYDFIEYGKRFRRKKVGKVPRFARRRKYGYQWSGTPNGMDNTPRGRDNYSKILWLDLLAQQALSAKYIAEIARILEKVEIEKEYLERYQDHKIMLNKYYWNDHDGIYYDIKRKNPYEHVKVKTPAAYWPMLAEMCNQTQANKLLWNAKDPHIFGGPIPWPSVSKDDKDFNPRGQYWRGGVWIPLAYMATKALEKYGFYETADENAYKLMLDMVKTYQTYSPHTIWEVYSPTESRPATYKRDIEKYRPNFCGWSALGPISLFIENVLGFSEVDALSNTLKWRLHNSHRHGIKRFRFGEIITNVLYDNAKVRVSANIPYNLYINEKLYKIKKGEQEIILEKSPS